MVRSRQSYQELGTSSRRNRNSSLLRAGGPEGRTVPRVISRVRKHAQGGP